MEKVCDTFDLKKYIKYSTEVTKAEWGIVTAGCAAALTHATAACIAGSNPEKMQRLPQLEGHQVFFVGRESPPFHIRGRRAPDLLALGQPRRQVVQDRRAAPAPQLRQERSQDKVPNADAIRNEEKGVHLRKRPPRLPLPALGR